ncbi:NAD-dependent malic enzyme, mitochondrial [Grus japonensis]|uniref:NAD-dependent malic enzyme, mitochondrial n=1 Tax=Grus japonensis TaxID=30415 RepID=A0ABC9XXM9_GRUJA
MGNTPPSGVSLPRARLFAPFSGGFRGGRDPPADGSCCCTIETGPRPASLRGQQPQEELKYHHLKPDLSSTKPIINHLKSFPQSSMTQPFHLLETRCSITKNNVFPTTSSCHSLCDGISQRTYERKRQATDVKPTNKQGYGLYIT